MKASDWLNQKEELKCSRCGRKSVSHSIGEVCLITQPEKTFCDGIFNKIL